NGSVATSFDAPAEGETLTVTAVLEDQFGNTSAEGSDSAVLDTTPTITIVSEVTVSEEGLAGGIEDSLPSGTDTTNSVSGSGQFTVTGGSGDMTVALAGGSGLTSNGETVAWTWDASTNRLLGHTNATDPVITVTLNEPMSGSLEWTYDVELHSPLDHPDTEMEDTLSLPISVVVNDDNRTDLSKPLSVTIEDDSPETIAVEVVPVELQDIPDVLIGKVSFTGQGSGDRLTLDDVTVTALGFANDYNTQLEYDKVNLSSDGIGVDSGSSSTPWPWPSNPDEHGHPLSNEIEYRITDTGQGVSEQLIFSLNGQVAYGAQIEFSKMYGGELESGIARFYRDGELVAEREFTSDETSGDYAKNFDIQEGGFDQITIEATDNGNRSSQDNSDLTVKSITFTGASDEQAIAVADGTLQYHAGADGLDSIMLEGIEDGLFTAQGLAITTQFDGNNRLIATDENGALVFEVQLTPATGKWEFYQYQVMQAPEGDSDIDFSYKVVDGDGDTTLGEFAVQPTSKPESQNHSIETGDGVDQIDMLSSAGVGWLSLNVGLSGSEKVVINDENFSINGPEVHWMSEFESDWQTTDNHYIDAGDGNDQVRGGEGDDIIVGGRGSDMLTGSEGADTFSWSMDDVNSQNGHEYTDTVSDFSAEDTLNLNDLFKGDEVNGDFSRFSVTMNDTNPYDDSVNVTLKFDYDKKEDADQTIELTNVKLEGGQVVLNTLIEGEKGSLTINDNGDGTISVSSDMTALDDIEIDTDW
ncbi:hypothetical protein BZG79_02155, partial [Salinivibrio sp. MA427]|uniref:type I secretion C-terminal target domain-containing protein n=1 Tax=Salinivibrio sp. MA427 TaxID=1909455 RepID=UPI0009D1B3D0